MRGLLIAFEGLDRSGKTTQIELLEKWLNSIGRSVTVIKFPERTTTIGQQINLFLQKKTTMSKQFAHLLFSINRWELKERIENELRSGKTVILDRYSYSGISYSVAQGLDYEWCAMPEYGLPKPDVLFYMKINEIGQLSKRGGFGGEVFEVKELQLKVKEVYETKIIRADWKLIDALRDINEIREEIQSQIENILETGCSSEINYLTYSDLFPERGS